MLFRSQIHLRATPNQFVFINGRQELSLATFVYVTEELKIAAVGETPDDAADFEKVDLFGSEAEHSSTFLEPFIRYGIYRVLNSSFQLFAPILVVTLDSSIQARLKKSASDIFKRACLDAGAGEVRLKLESPPDD
jgi:hypothetical protein